MSRVISSKYLAAIFLIPTLALIGCKSGEQTQTDVDNATVTPTQQLISYQELITEEYLNKHLSAFAADSMSGRETGTRYERKAANYLVQEYQKLGLKGGAEEGYLQKFEIAVTIYDSLRFTIRDQDSLVIAQSASFAGMAGALTPLWGGAESIAGEVVFAGFGVDDPARNVTHLGEMDLAGKWVLIFNEFPTVTEVGDTLINPVITSRSRFRELLFRRGAAGVAVIAHDTTENYTKFASDRLSRFEKPSNFRLPYLQSGEEQQGPGGGYFFIRPDWAAKLLGLGDTGQLSALRDSLARPGHLTKFQPSGTGYQLASIPFVRQSTIESSNVIAVHRGGDPELEDELVVLSAHYDHVGVGAPDSTGDAIYNGADDDGSGTIGMLNIAWALSAAAEEGMRPRRSIMLLSVSAEEKGLLGSRYYSDHPTWPMEQTIANINLDMIGRVDPTHQEEEAPNYIYTIGGEIISSGLDSLVTLANQQAGQLELDDRYNDLNDPNQFYRRSDHWNFGRLGVPFIFFFNGTHEDYHQPGDEVEKIAFEPYVNRVKTIYGSVVLLANSDTKPKVDNQAFIEKTQVEVR